jgi:hypothetical protein
LPNLLCASVQLATAPGTVSVAGRMPRNGISLMPLSRNQPMSARAAARPPPSRNLIFPDLPSWISQNASPPMLVMCGYKTANAALVAIAASTADPPARNTSTPAAEASACGEVTMPLGASVTGRPVDIGKCNLQHNFGPVTVPSQSESTSAAGCGLPCIRAKHSNTGIKNAKRRCREDTGVVRQAHLAPRSQSHAISHSMRPQPTSDESSSAQTVQSSHSTLDHLPSVVKHIGMLPFRSARGQVHKCAINQKISHRHSIATSTNLDHYRPASAAPTVTSKAPTMMSGDNVPSPSAASSTVDSSGVAYDAAPKSRTCPCFMPSSQR